jgi:hypothetical protein
MKKIFLICVIFSFYFQSLRASDSLKVYIVGNFHKGEEFKFHIPKKTFLINIRQDRLACWYFYLPIDSTIKEGSLLPIIIEKKKRGKFYNVELMCFYQPDRRFFILWKDRRQSKEYPFIELWSKKPHGSITISKSFWDNEFDPKFVPPTINEMKYDYFFNHLDEFYKKQEY